MEGERGIFLEKIPEELSLGNGPNAPGLDPDPSQAAYMVYVLLATG